MPRKYFIALDQGWSDWDLQIYRGVWSKVQIKVCNENHGGAKRLLRVWCALRMSRVATIALCGYPLLAALGLALGMTEAAVATIVVGGVNALAIFYQNFRLGRILYHVLEIVAKKVGLLPVEG